jgi:hypothetical protein
MKFKTMQEELAFIVRDDRLREWLPRWINEAIFEIATQYNLPPLALANPYELSTDTTNWLWPLPKSFHKNLFLVKWRADNDRWVIIHRNYKNPAELVRKDHTIIAEKVREVAVVPQGKDYFFGVHPMAIMDFQLWFYQKPLYLEEPDDECDCIPFNFVPQVIYPKVIIKNYEFIVDQVTDFPYAAGSLQYWQGELRRGLIGAPGLGTGLLGFYNINFHPPRRTGGRDPIGWRPYWYGSGF